MAGNTFVKRQKERARQEKQKAKAERRLQRKQEKGPNSLDDQIASPEEVAALYNLDDTETADNESEEEPTS
jgi:hypothetical protein